jgi:PilZ domain
MSLNVAYRKNGEDGVGTCTSISRRSLAYLKLIELCYKYAFLLGRKRLGVRLSPAELQDYESLRQTMQGDPERQRRSHRRFPLKLPAVAKLEQGNLRKALVLNVSGNGMYIACHSAEVRRGDTLQIKLGQPDEVEYLFTCEVIRCVHSGETAYLGLSFSCVPLEIRK